MRSMLALSFLPIAAAVAQSPTFADPVRLQAGDALLGEGRLYPSPVWHDLDGDGRLDIVVGDLRGHLTVARGVLVDGRPGYLKEEKVLGADGKIVDLKNW
jgi:hypothetical protein